MNIQMQINKYLYIIVQYIIVHILRVKGFDITV